MKKAALHNLGCKVNSYETEAMEQILMNGGYEIVAFDQIADIYIINTCSVTNIADRKSRQMLHKAKKMNQNAIVIATGCYAQAQGKELSTDEAVDIVIGNNKKSELLSIIEQFEIDNRNNVALADAEESIRYEELNIESVYEHTRAYIKIQDGCNQFCSYCIIPYMRGRVRSREMVSVVEEVKKVAHKGYREIVLTGIHLSSYGLELENASLLELLIHLNSIEGIDRIRLGSLEPRIVTEEFVQKIIKLEKVCPHFHLSLQSGCDITLKRMNRRYDTKEYEEKCVLLRKYYENPAITTDVIVGFPGESDAEFLISKEFVEKIKFSEIHVFKYSNRKGTAADIMPNQTPDSAKNERSKVLIGIGEELNRQYISTFIGKEVDVLFEEVISYMGKSYVVGHTKNYIKIYLQDETKDLKNNIVNCIKNVKVEKILENGIVLASLS